MARINWSQDALLDLSRVQLFLARENPSAAMRAATKIQQQVDLLAIYPEFGPRDGTAAGQRKLIVPFGENNYPCATAGMTM